MMLDENNENLLNVTLIILFPNLEYIKNQESSLLILYTLRSNHRYYFIKIGEKILQIITNNDYELYNLKAFSLINLRKYTKAFDMLNKSLHVMPNNAETFLYRGLLYANVLDTVKCLQNMNKALQINPKL